MEWAFVIIILLSAVFYALAGFVDNFITDAYFRGRRPEAQKIFSIIAHGLTLVFMLIFLPPQSFSFPHALILIAAGAIDALSCIPYYRALAHEETTGITILVQFSPVIALFAGFFVLGDTISPLQLFAILMLLLAAFLIIFSHGKARLHLQLRAAALILVTIILWNATSTLFAFSGDEFNFSTSFFYLILGNFTASVIFALVMKPWRTRVKNVFRRFRWKSVGVYMLGHGSWLAGETLWSLALLSVPIALATALESTIQLIATFALGLALTIIWPRFGRERLTRRTVSYHLLALIFSIAAIFLIQLS